MLIQFIHIYTYIHIISWLAVAKQFIYIYDMCIYILYIFLTCIYIYIYKYSTYTGSATNYTTGL